MDPTAISPEGLAFVRLHEGFVSKTYKDSVGVLTIGEGYTMRSATFAAYWKSSRGHDLRIGDTITKAECDMLTGKLMADEYAKPIPSEAHPHKQNQFDACASVSYNAGPGSLKDHWAVLLAAGDVHGSAVALRAYKLTHGILKSRRAAEATLLETGDYGKIDMSVHGTPDAPSVATSAEDVLDYQKQLAALGFYKGALDGRAGPQTKQAVLVFQGTHPELRKDGIVGPATRAALANDVAAKAAAPATPAAVVTKAVTEPAVPPAVIAGAGATAAVATASSGRWVAFAIIIVVTLALVIGCYFLFRALKRKD